MWLHATFTVLYLVSWKLRLNILLHYVNNIYVCFIFCIKSFVWYVSVWVDVIIVSVVTVDISVTDVVTQPAVNCFIIYCLKRDINSFIHFGFTYVQFALLFYWKMEDFVQSIYFILFWRTTPGMFNFNRTWSAV